MSRLYRVKEFAELAGVTVKALHHYDRLGLLQPARTAAGYRTYAERDLERLEQIVALKFLGVPLKQIRSVLDSAPLRLTEALRMQREALEQKQALLTRAVRAVQAAEAILESGKPAAPAVLRRIIEVINVENDIAVMRKYYPTEEAWQKLRRYYEEGPSQEWRDLYRDVQAALGTDPGGETAQALADRWLKLGVRAHSGDPDVQTDSMAAWQDRRHWPPEMKRRLEAFQVEEARQFIAQAAFCMRKKYFDEAAWSKWQEMRNRHGGWPPWWQARVDLFAAVEACLDEDPAGEKGQALAARWAEHLEMISEGDAGVRAGVDRSWADRPNWTATLRWVEEGLTRLTGDRFTRAADFLDQAIASVGQVSDLPAT